MNLSNKKQKILSSDALKILILFAVAFVQIAYYIFMRGGFTLSDDWQSIEMTFSYKNFGFIKRGLIGEAAQRLADLLKTDVSYSFYSKIQLISMLIFTAAFFLFFIYLFRHIKKENKQTAFIISLFFISFGGIAFYYLDWAEPDIYILCLTFISFICILKGRFLFIVPVNCALSAMIHEGYPLMLFMLVMVPLFYKWLSAEKLSADKYFFTLLVSGLITSALFVYFYFFSEVGKGVSLEYVQQRALDLTKTDQKQNIEYLFFGGSAPMNGFWENGKHTKYLLKDFVNILMNIALYLPILYYIFKVKKDVLHKCENAKEKIKYAVCSFGFAFLAILFLCHTDTGRWLNDFWLYELFIFMFMLVTGDKYFTESLKDNLKSITTAKAFLLCAPYFMLSFAINKQWINLLTERVSEEFIEQILCFTGNFLK